MMTLRIPSKWTMILAALWLGCLIVTRFYNLDHTARFTQDESSDLSRMYQYYREKRITLVGPISNDNGKVFSSLTYYMLMPFAYAGGFTPVSPVYGMAVYGCLTALCILGIVYELRRAWLYPAALLLLIWYPLLEMSRWAWNPHFVALWASLGMYAWLQKKRYPVVARAVAGLSFGLMFHHHYLSVLATGPLVLYFLYADLKHKKYREASALFTAYMLPYMVFVLFDLRHPPGLFFGRYLLSGNTPDVQKTTSAAQYLSNLMRNYWVMVDTFVKPFILKTCVAILLPLLMYFDLRSRKVSLNIWYLPLWLVVLVGVILVDFQVRYVYPAVVFAFVWLITPRKSLKAQLVALSILGCIFVGSLFSFWKQLTRTAVPPDMYSFTILSTYIRETIKSQQVKNPNITVASSPDSAPLGEKYRDYIGMDGTQFRASSEYDLSENLFIITTTPYESVREKDKSFALLAFKKASLKGSFEVPNSEWKVYWIGY